MKLKCPNCGYEVDSIELIRYYGHELNKGVVDHDFYTTLIRELKKPQPMISCSKCDPYRESFMQVVSLK